MRKVPWGILAGITAMAWSFVTVGLIAGSLVVNTIYSTGGVNEGTPWWIILLGVFEALTVIAFGVFMFFYVKCRSLAKPADKKKNGECKNENI